MKLSDCGHRPVSRDREAILTRTCVLVQPQAVPHRLDRLRQAGFTLLEILVVIAILGLLIGLVAPAALRQLGGAKVSVAHQSIERMASVLDLYKLDVGSYPSTEQGLAALSSRPASVSTWNGPYLKGDGQTLDPWNHAYLYQSPAPNGQEFALCSKGPNGTATDASSGLICNK